MRVIHEWCLEVDRKGLRFITVKVLEDAFFCEPNTFLVIDFMDLCAYFKMDKMDINLAAV